MTKFQLYTTIVLAIILCISTILYKFRHKHNMANPEYVKQLQERQEEYRRKKEEDKELDDIIGADADQYQDD